MTFLNIAARATCLNDNRPAFYLSELAKGVTKGFKGTVVNWCRCKANEGNDRQAWTGLRKCAPWRGYCCETNQNFAPLHSITSSARARIRGI